MSLYSIETQQFGLKKEGTRGTAESAPVKWLPTRGKVDMNYVLKKLKDEGIRGIAAQFPELAGVKDGDGKIPLYLDAQTAVEFFYSLLGSVSSAQQGSTTAYKHTLVRAATISKPSYTFFLDRGLNVLKYNLGVVKKVSLKGGVDSLIEMDVDALFKSEASGSIGTPDFGTQQYLGFQNVTFKIAGTQSTDVKEWNLSIDNGAAGHRTLANSQDVSDILAPGRLMIEGGFTVFFQDTTERDKFIANTGTAIEIVASGAEIASPYNYEVDINIYQAMYKAFAYGEDQGLLAAKAQFTGLYSASDSKEIQIDVTNTDTSY